MKIKRAIPLLTTLFFFTSCSVQTPKPKLVVFMVLDQCRPDLITRYSPLYTGGLKWIEDHGLYCSQTYHAHGYTATGPGHFTLASGQYPGPAGILGNDWWDRKERRSRYCVEDNQAKIVGGEGTGRSYRRYNTTAFGDWLKASDPKSKVASVAGKDRAAVFSGGKHPDFACWYNWDGRFVTSDYYADALPDWLQDLNKSLHVETYKDSLWTKSLLDSVYLQYAREDNFHGETDTYKKDPYSPVFPIGFDPASDATDKIGGTPWLDQFTLEAAQAMIEGEGLGKDSHTDIAFISLSGVDIMVHYFGPWSQEAMDSQIKLDKHLGKFFHWLDEEIGLENILVVQTSDHGGLPLPDYLKKVRHLDAGHINHNVWKATTNALQKEVTELTGIPHLLKVFSTRFFIDDSLIQQTSVPRTKILNLIDAYCDTVTGVSRIMHKDDILNATSEDSILFAMRHSMNPDGPDAWALEKRNWVWKYPYGTSHGTPYSYDQHVPLYLCRQSTQASEFSDKIHTVDIAPTLARYLDIKPTHHVDGHVVTELVHNLKGN